MVLNIVDKLPELLVPFSASFVPSAKLVFSKKKISSRRQKQLLNAYAYVVEATTRAETHKVFYAERYGGSGILHNGGGGRCGIGNQLQVKGIGLTPLIGDGYDISQLDGKLTLQSAVCEIVWSRIFKNILPYGVVDIEHLLALPSGGVEDEIYSLMLRSQHLRLAHFQRAIYFKSRLGGLADAERVKVSVQKLAAYLPYTKTGCALDRAGIGAMRDIRHGLFELVQRFLVQYAELKIRRLVHTASPSNLTIEGRLLDFGTVDILPASESTTFVWDRELKNQDMVLIAAIVDVAYNCEKYCAGCAGLTAEVRRDVQRLYAEKSKTILFSALLNLLGLDQGMLSDGLNGRVVVESITLLLEIETARRFKAGDDGYLGGAKISSLGKVLLLIFFEEGSIAQLKRSLMSYVDSCASDKLSSNKHNLRNELAEYCLLKGYRLESFLYFLNTSIVRAFQCREQIVVSQKMNEMLRYSNKPGRGDMSWIAHYVDEKVCEGDFLFGRSCFYEQIVWPASPKIVYKGSDNLFIITIDGVTRTEGFDRMITFGHLKAIAYDCYKFYLPWLVGVAR
ncbi:hypothetical protein FX982_04464 [Pseudomonas graminis]|uniref:Uncharacterized protein n=1 Tax=Pseudomonas graminis TaxID=158627 RepID=A0A6M8MUK8_9PSED|nr:hypothetical protein FX982_04464 [Pseudomonas graminis]